MKAFKFFPARVRENDVRIMIFVDGENFAIRYGKILSKNVVLDHIDYVPNIFVWSTHLNLVCVCANVIRRYYYTSAVGDNEFLQTISQRIKDAGIEAPRVFKKSKSRGSKRVDISIATDMLTHAHRKNYDVAVLIAGDEDYVPLVEAVQAEGRRVFLWFFEQGLSPALKHSVDRYNDVSEILFEQDHHEIL